MPFEALLGAPIDQVSVDLERHVLAMPYSSGTTGLPKGVMLSHANLVANVAQIAAIEPVRPGERTLAVLPFFHIYGMTVLMAYILAGGGALVTLPRFELEAALRLAAEHRMRRLFVVPPVVLALAKHPLVAGFDLSALEIVFSGAAPLGAELEAACAGRLGCAVVQGYGMTEMSPVSHFTPAGRYAPGSAGATVPNTRCRIVDPETGADLPAGEVGELWVQGPQVMLGYLNNPEATEATLKDGWLRTGDLGRIDKDGNLHIVDRVKELIKVKGFQVPPAELEALLVTHPEVSDCAVIGLPDEECGEVPAAFVVRAAGAEPLPEALQAFVASHVAHYKQLRKVTFVEAIPKSPSGKILRRLLRAGADG
jgi:acyl-CoA synthetase (AMP-forming)/AMP-acid ligase II